MRRLQTCFHWCCWWGEGNGSLRCAANYLFSVVPAEDVILTGFGYAEIKPLSASGERTLTRQIGNWGLDIRQVQAITYDAKGNVYFGFR